MPHGSVHNHWLAFDNARLQTRARLFRRNLDCDSFSEYAGLATDGHNLITTCALHQHITHHAQNPFRGLNDLESKVTATTRQWIPLCSSGTGNRTGSISSDLTRVDTVDSVVRQGQCRTGTSAPTPLFRGIFKRCLTGQSRAFRVNEEVYLPPVRCQPQARSPGCRPGRCRFGPAIRPRARRPRRPEKRRPPARASLIDTS